MLRGLNQKVSSQDKRLFNSFVGDVELPAERQNLTYFGIYAERGKPVIVLAKGK